MKSLLLIFGLVIITITGTQIYINKSIDSLVSENRSIRASLQNDVGVQALQGGEDNRFYTLQPAHSLIVSRIALQEVPGDYTDLQPALGYKFVQ